MIFFNKTQILAHNPWLDDLILLENTNSTQIDAKTGQPNTLYLTNQQTATYGRFGRPYFADEGGIYMSANLGPADQEQPVQYTILAAAALITAIEKLSNQKPTIKWVNDIYLNGKKLAGILAEAGSNGIVLGMGINFQIKNFPADLAERATSLFLTEAPTMSPSDLVAEIWSEFHRLKNGDYFEIYKSHCFVLGMTVEFKQNNQTHQGLAADLTPLGELVVKCDDGIQRILNSGEISLKSWTD